MDIGFNITMGCDKACHFCFLNLDGRNLDLETFVKALDSNTFDRVTLSGGEPFVREDIWIFLDEIQKRGLDVNIITNGTFLNADTVARLTEVDGLKLYISYHRPNETLRDKVKYAHEQGVSTHGHIVLETPAYRKIEQIFDDLYFVNSVMILYPTNTGGESKISMFGADEWQLMIQHILGVARGYKFEVYYEPAFARRDMPGLEEAICPAGKDPFIHVDGKAYPCCLLVDTEHGKAEAFDPILFDYHKCPVLNVKQDIENGEYRRICPLVFTNAKRQKYVFPSRIKELRNE